VPLRVTRGYHPSPLCGEGDNQWFSERWNDAVGKQVHRRCAAMLGFVVTFGQGASTPDGHLEFQYKAGDINLKSRMSWLVVQSATKVRFKGLATINGAGPYAFKVMAEDNGEPGTSDTFQIDIWQGVVDTENGPPTPKHRARGVLGGGNIKIHRRPLMEPSRAGGGGAPQGPQTAHPAQVPTPACRRPVPLPAGYQTKTKQPLDFHVPMVYIRNMLAWRTDWTVPPHGLKEKTMS
jgi:hypothetical protein